jgi:hypothetical protein
MNPTRSAGYLAALAVSVISRCLLAAPETHSSDGGFDVHEWAVFVLDASQNQINPEGMVFSTLPQACPSRRQAAPADQADWPMPIGVIRLSGTCDSRVDVTVEKSAGEFHASWPTADKRSNQLLWRNLTVSADAGPRGVEAVPENHWISALRSTPSAYLSTSPGPCERFLLYDVQMPYPSPLQLKRGSPHSLEVTNSGPAAVHRLVFFQQIDKVWNQTTPTDLPAAQASTTKSSIASTSASTTAPASQPAWTAAHSVVTLTHGPTTRPIDPGAVLRPLLGNAEIADSDRDLILQIVRNYVLDSPKLTAVYVLDGSEFDRVLPLDVVPQPRKITRLGLVIVKNADPASGSEIDDLIAQLGDPVWAKRDEAYHALERIGPAASAKLGKATSNRDIEIVWRAERLLARLKPAAQQ